MSCKECDFGEDNGTCKHQRASTIGMTNCTYVFMDKVDQMENKWDEFQKNFTKDKDKQKQETISEQFNNRRIKVTKAVKGLARIFFLTCLAFVSDK